ncbi:hypothetical protein BDY19DRAFT_570946 [Irpex rosettiformis]|uniref:Uncharacterized protein n=1 Tax=Irpex rosettiformis TaxID=378272 RepID=A0ACB8UCL9_9APHY|nr:hypothetical protein BDY19DRAFT_570946 [Irpex rosettiformis]
MKHSSHEMQNAAATSSSRLTVSNLRSNSNLAKFDKGCFVDAYVQSQRTYRKTFELEGRAVCATWGKENGDGVCTDQIAPNIPGCGFTTPILKPRVPEDTSLHDEDIPRDPPAFFSNKKDTLKSESQARQSCRRPTNTTRSVTKQYNTSGSRKGTLDDFLNVSFSLCPILLTRSNTLQSSQNGVSGAAPRRPLLILT